MSGSVKVALHFEMLNSLNRPSCQTKGKVAMMYKIVNNLAVIPEAPSLLRPVHHPYPTHYAHNLYFHAHKSLFLYSHFPSSLT